MGNKVVKVKKDVQLVELLDYGFKFDIQTERYLRIPQYLSKNVGFCLIVELKTREVYYHIWDTKEINNLVDEDSEEILNTALVPFALLNISHLLEVVENENSYN